MYDPRLTLRQHIKQIAEEALTANEGNRTKTAEALGICRRTMRGWISLGVIDDVPNKKEAQKYEKHPQLYSAPCKKCGDTVTRRNTSWRLRLCSVCFEVSKMRRYADE
jgi:hypothetical protein